MMYVGISRQFTQQHVRISRKESPLLMREGPAPGIQRSLCLLEPAAVVACKVGVHW